MTKRLQAVGKDFALDALPQKCKCHKQHKSTNFFGEDICALCAHSWLGELSPRWATPGAGARAVMKSQLNSRRELRMCVNTHKRRLH